MRTGIADREKIICNKKNNCSLPQRQKKDRVFGFSVQEQKIHERLLNDEASTKEFKDRYLRV